MCVDVSGQHPDGLSGETREGRLSRCEIPLATRGHDVQYIDCMHEASAQRALDGTDIELLWLMCSGSKMKRNLQYPVLAR